MKVLPRRDLRKLTLKDDIVPKLTSLGAICCASPAAPQGLPAVLTLREVDGGLHQGLSRKAPTPHSYKLFARSASTSRILKLYVARDAG